MKNEVAEKRDSVKIVVKETGKCYTCPSKGICYNGLTFRSIRYIVGVLKRGTKGMAIVNQVGGIAVTNVRNSELDSEPVLLKVSKTVIMNQRHPCSFVYKTAVVAKGRKDVSHVLKQVYNPEDVLFQATLPTHIKKELLNKPWITEDENIGKIEF